MNFLDKYICKDLQYIICGFLSPNKTELHWDIQDVKYYREKGFRVKEVCVTIHGMKMYTKHTNRGFKDYIKRERKKRLNC